MLLTGNDAIAALYTSDAAVAALAASLLLYAALFQFPDGVQVLSAGALRGLKDTRIPMLLAMLAYWGIGMPVGAGLGLALGWGPRGMWLGLTAGLTVAAFLMAPALLAQQPARPHRVPRAIGHRDRRRMSVSRPPASMSLSRRRIGVDSPGVSA